MVHTMKHFWKWQVSKDGMFSSNVHSTKIISHKLRILFWDTHFSFLIPEKQTHQWRHKKTTTYKTTKKCPWNPKNCPWTPNLFPSFVDFHFICWGLQASSKNSHHQGSKAASKKPLTTPWTKITASQAPPEPGGKDQLLWRRNWCKWYFFVDSYFGNATF